MAQAEADAAIEALLILAKGLSAREQHFQAVKCLEAVCRSSAQMPVAAVKTRLWLSQLLLQYTQNINEATQHLQQAQLLLKQVPGCHALKCEVLSELGRCQRYLARPKLEIQAYQRGLQICSSGQKSTERSALQQWQVHFGQRLTDIHIVQGNLQDAQQSLDQALQAAVHISDTSKQVLLQLAQLQLHMLGQNTAATTQVLSSCTALLVQLAQGPHQEPLSSQLQLHFCILRALSLMSEGQYMVLLKTARFLGTASQKVEHREKLHALQSCADKADKSSILAISEMEGLVKQIGGREWEYAWLPTAAVQALVAWLAATLYRPHGKFKQALAHLSQAQQVIDEELRCQGIQGTENELPPQTVCNHHTLLYIKFLIIEGAAIVHLTQMDLVKAQRDLTVLLELCTAHPALLGKPLLSSLYMLIGHYAVAAGDPAAAAVRFVAVTHISRGATQARLAAVSAALALLATQQPDDIPKAAQILRQCEVFGTPDAKLPFAERGAGYFATAMVLIAQGQDKEGRFHLSKALNHAHGVLSSHQLVSQIMNVMAPAQLQRGDKEGAKTMLQSSFTLSTALHDMPTLVASLQGISELYGHLRDTSNYNDSLQHADRKRVEYMQIIQHANSTPSHRHIMQWQGFS